MKKKTTYVAVKIEGASGSDLVINIYVAFKIEGASGSDLVMHVYFDEVRFN